VKRKPVKGEFRFSPLTIPLKTTKKGAAAPFLGFSPEFGSYRGFFKLTKREADAYLRVRRGYRNTLRLFPLQLERQFVCVRCAMQPLQERRPFDFHTSNIQRAQTKRRARCIVRLGNPIRRPPEGRLDYGRRNDNTHNVTTSFFCATALFRVSSALFFHIFSRKREKIWPAERRPLCRKPHRASGAFEKQQRLHFGYKKPPLRAAFHLPSQQSFAPAGMASSTISRCSFSSPFSLWTAEISIPQDWRPIILRGGRLIMATSVLPTSSSGL